MTSKKQAESKPQSVPPEDWPWPEAGGSYLRDPVTGELTPRNGGEAQDKTGEADHG